ncbi:hypothetical protein M569_15168, partial [Genlisea aurea]
KRNDVEEDEFRVLTAVKTIYNDIVIIDTSKERLLLLDSTHNVHSKVIKGGKWTGSYWDEFATLPPVVPEGPIAIFGLGGGTAAHLMLDLWPSLQLEGWEIDEILIDKSREYFGLSSLEQPSSSGGVLNIHIGDVFSPEHSAVSGGYAGIIVDLFVEGRVLPQLEQAATWMELQSKLMPNGRVMVNCGGGGEGGVPPPVIGTMCDAFPGQVFWKQLGIESGDNYVALTGREPDWKAWADSLPHQLKSCPGQWK